MMTRGQFEKMSTRDLKATAAVLSTDAIEACDKYQAKSEGAANIAARLRELEEEYRSLASAFAKEQEGLAGMIDVCNAKAREANLALEVLKERYEGRCELWPGF